ncbi:electron transfer flavoprotein subunit beta/FixA family protein [Cryobacterium sp. Y50]|uniref:electron transfer flavoprotein subunit beta/FixA family protein n=1 Tax=Cryobacterium sp. Y50 TaxID=2048286 RepID=UPI000CE3B2F3|nr:electron transfer flavoprotein subunit beta/FixA family protein [Cryobacterium sp. Y50]
MNVVVLIKQVPDTYGERKLSPEGRLDRDVSDVIIDEINERAVEIALQLQEDVGGEVTVVTMGPKSAVDTIRKALAMGANKAIHIVDDGLAGSDALQTSGAIAAALKTIEFDLVIAGNESTDGRSSAVPAMLSERLKVSLLTNLVTLSVAQGSVAGTRSVENGTMEVRASLPAVVSVAEKIADPRFPKLKGVLAARRKPITTLSISDLGLFPLEAGGENSWTQVNDVIAQPARTSGTVITDDGTAGTQLAGFLAAAKLI